MATIKTITVALEAQTATFTQGMKKATDELRNLSNQAKGMGDSINFMGAIAKAGAFVGAIKGGIAAIGAATAAWNGDMEGSVAALKKLPLGVGELVSQVWDLGQAWNGTAAAQEKYNDGLKKIEEFGKGQDKVQAIRIAAENALSLVGLSPEQKQAAQLGINRDKALEELRQQKMKGINTTRAEKAVIETYVQEWNAVWSEVGKKAQEKRDENAKDLADSLNKGLWEGVSKNLGLTETPLDKYGQSLAAMREASKFGAGSFLDFNKSMADALKGLRGDAPDNKSGSFMDITGGMDIRSYMGGEAKTIAQNTADTVKVLNEIKNKPAGNNGLVM